LAFGFTSKAQSLTPEVVATSGDFYTSATANLSWTLGELAVETYEGSSNILTQGFQQTDPGTTTGFVSSETFEVLVYPNPVLETLNLQLTDLSGELKIELFDMKGSLMHARIIPVFTESLQQIDMSGFPSGLYLLKLTGVSDKVSQTIKIQKIN
jgi:hypothetical protein